ncbi:MAG: DUF4382 domain-containing protein, partial [Pelovirga sp.]
DHANYLIMADNSINELKIPSGPQTGIKLVSGFTINQNQTTELLLDFDAMRSVVKAGKSGKYLLKPTIKVLDRGTESTVQGTVASTEGSPIAGAFVSAQAGDPLSIRAGTISDDDVSDEKPGYKLFLEPGNYTLVVTADGYEPACKPLTLTSGDQLLTDFDLTPPAEESETFTLDGTVTVADSDEGQSVTLSFYQTVNCNDATSASVVVRELNFDADDEGVDYQLTLPAGSYNVVATHYVTVDDDEEEEEVTSTFEFSINLNNNLIENINF